MFRDNKKEKKYFKWKRISIFFYKRKKPFLSSETQTKGLYFVYQKEEKIKFA